MSFEIKEKDLLARIGRLKTKNGIVETPTLLPVINPTIQIVSPKRIKKEFGFDAIITNAYIVRKRFGDHAIAKGLHGLLDFEGIIMTDSGAYQTLVYGDVEVKPEEIVAYQEQIGTNIGTILDIPTGWSVSERDAQKTVNETLKRAKELFTSKTRKDIAWVGPIQGGRYPELVAKSAREMGKLAFQIHALGSPTEVMERYRFDVLVDMIMSAKLHMPIDRPLHLFGAGHPFMFALAVALGCDMFDSAAYVLYAKEGRYMTQDGTWKLKELDYFPCSCPSCRNAQPSLVRGLSEEEKMRFLAEHNLNVCAAELRSIKQAIKEGRLWEHVETRTHSHPRLLSAVRRLRKYENHFERLGPVTKPSGLLYFSSTGLARPEIVHYRKNLLARYREPSDGRTLILIPQTKSKPFHKSHEFTSLSKSIKLQIRGKIDRAHVCLYSAPFGVVPIELDEVYPVSQHETAMPLDAETIEYVADQVGSFIESRNYKKVFLFHNPEDWGTAVLNASRKACKRRNIEFKSRRTKAILKENRD